MRPLAGPRSLIGPTRLKNGSLPKLFVRNCVMSCGPGVSAAIASCTASLTSAGFIPTSSGRLVLPVEALGEVRRLAPTPRWVCAVAPDGRERRRDDAILRQRRNDDERGENEGKCASQHGLSPCEGCSIVQGQRPCAPGFLPSSSRSFSAPRWCSPRLSPPPGWSSRPCWTAPAGISTTSSTSSRTSSPRRPTSRTRRSCSPASRRSAAAAAAPSSRRRRRTCCGRGIAICARTSCW